MDFEERKQKALAIMASRKMWKSNYAPPLIRLLWWLGVKFPPLPFASFWQVFSLMTGGFSVGYGLLMYFMVWRPQGMSPLFACAVSLIAGVLFGLTMALFHLWRRRANKLPDWQDL
ncbi:DUF6404 family protein (plasmid) [Klebsiella michiganensis]|uniref:DUF6404 family protein n=1 Tax=Klebsiella michiganensis TaxID=1134687 RepID=UPI0026582207|nr:DUF6404 family protein [Klebsiella michiganensis]WKK01112.1 DUF6404 family protein [Klebsiella michiganensis]WKK03817.1 DUF6404 family protein [Klebsiella michiganensis]WKK06932.1 DUF6404 family protein [Klebsiella michiganensis]WKK07123.1 DUF6404 family protein [Klebsiella michiganensis]